MKEEDSDHQLQEEQSSASSSGVAAGEIIIGVLTGLDSHGNALVNFAENRSDESIVAISTIALHQGLSGRQVALLFTEGNLLKPVIMGLIHSPLNQLIESFEMKTEESQTVETDQNLDKGAVVARDIDDAYMDGKRIVLEGKEEIVLKCGDASITLTKAGKILIRGKYLLNRSSGVNRIMGGSVQVN